MAGGDTGAQVFLRGIRRSGKLQNRRSDKAQSRTERLRLHYLPKSAGAESLKREGPQVQKKEKKEKKIK